MFVGEERNGEVWDDLTGNRQESVTIGKDGWAVFPVNGGSVSVWALPDSESADEEQGVSGTKDV
ncbi:Glucan 1,4-alpha-maltohexaosidase precursor [compost metagenome]